jgi:hypothetical protein
MGLRPTHGDENARLELIDSKWVMHDFQGSVMAIFQQLLSTDIFWVCYSPPI